MAPTIRNPHAGFIDLTHDQVLVLDDRVGSRVQVLCGGIWLTEEKSEQDRFFEAGGGLQIDRRGRVVIQPLSREARVRITEPVRAGAARWVARLGRLLARRPAWLAHTGAAALALLLSVGVAELTARSFQIDGGAMHASIASTSAAAPARPG